ncbi:MAG: hypothetical protein V1886_03430 [archaeon]
MIDVDEKKRKIAEIIGQRGPSLPIHVTKGAELSILFASAILSEMVSNRTLRVSNLKVGGSPLYYLPGQEPMLENFYTYLPSKEKEVFLLLQKHHVLEEESLLPALRVAIRNIKDFASQFSIKAEEGEKVFWRFNSFSHEEAVKSAEAALNKARKPKKEAAKEAIAPDAAEKPVIRAEKPQPKRSEDEFTKKVHAFLEKEKIRILSEEESKKKSMIMKALVSSSIGDIEMLVIAKDKKSISENDIRVLLSYNQARRLPVLFLCDGNPSKKALAEIENFKSTLFLRKIR